jgi:hypothetical protein
MSESVQVGIDVAKTSFEVAATGEAQILSVNNDGAGHALLSASDFKWIAPCFPHCVLRAITLPSLDTLPKSLIYKRYFRSLRKRLSLNAASSHHPTLLKHP